MGRPLLRARQLRSVGPGQRWIVERELAADGRVYQHLNEGTPEPTKPWRSIGRWVDLEVERRRLIAEGWELDD